MRLDEPRSIRETRNMKKKLLIELMDQVDFEELAKIGHESPIL